MAEEGAAPVHVTYHPGDPRSTELSVRVGDEIVLALHGTVGYAWAPVTGAEGPLVLVSAESREGVIRATVRARGEGEAELRSTSSFRGDRFGPQTLLWRLSVRVTADAP
ncbi:hypothetical protein [Streptomyces sp. NPDC050485]|uniref:hypothetical protein n=1 Tax=Streptomyces sp. NPDC050485 TaxID=3365617 RepID=UPI00378DA961